YYSKSVYVGQNLFLFMFMYYSKSVYVGQNLFLFMFIGIIQNLFMLSKEINSIDLHKITKKKKLLNNNWIKDINFISKLDI
ncbi:hypothetical protein ACJX0J_018110, partial [Zea mays]